MAVLLKTTSVQVSFIQIIQIRVQNKANEFGKVAMMGTYLGRVALPSSGHRRMVASWPSMEWASARPPARRRWTRGWRRLEEGWVALFIGPFKRTVLVFLLPLYVFFFSYCFVFLLCTKWFSLNGRLVTKILGDTMELPTRFGGCFKSIQFMFEFKSST